MVLASLMLMAAAGPIKPNGAHVRPTDQCFVIEVDGRPVGVTHQVVRKSVSGDQRVWDVVVHQKAEALNFDMRDHFILRRSDLLPIQFDSQKDGVEHVRLVYSDGRVVGYKTGEKGRAPVDSSLPGPTWEGNLWGVTFGALPLRSGAEFSLPFFQYDKGLGQFTLKTAGGETVLTPSGPVEAWRVDAGADAAHRVTYLIEKRTGAELGTRAGKFATRLGGDCSGIH
jgi:hypothetical protein